MKANLIVTAVKGKGPRSLSRRIRAITRSYDLASSKMDRSLQLYAQTLRQFDCGASFPITAISLKRNSRTIARYLDQNIEFAVHGYIHTDYSQLSTENQLTHLQRARKIFANTSISALGFRCPYLRWSDDTLAAVRQQGLTYDSSQADRSLSSSAGLLSRAIRC
jgi:peptidoglycan/xylan/chitin deacetylase (PgdA/CDA1 family)